MNREEDINKEKVKVYVIGHKNPDKLLKCADEMTSRAEGFHARGDYDSEDRCMVQRGAILRAAGLLGLEVSAQ